MKVHQWFMSTNMINNYYKWILIALIKKRLGLETLKQHTGNVSLVLISLYECDALKLMFTLDLTPFPP